MTDQSCRHISARCPVLASCQAVAENLHQTYISDNQSRNQYTISGSLTLNKRDRYQYKTISVTLNPTLYFPPLNCYFFSPCTLPVACNDSSWLHKSANSCSITCNCCSDYVYNFNYRLHSRGLCHCQCTVAEAVTAIIVVMYSLVFM